MYAAWAMGSVLLAGLGVSASALVARQALLAYGAWAAAPRAARLRGYYPGGFKPAMDRAEAAKILGVREYAPPEKVRDAHRKLMIANHPDSGGSSFIATKINEAKDLMLGKGKGRAAV